MKKLLIIFLLLSNFAFGQAPSVVVRLTNATTPIGQNVPKGSMLIDSNTGDVYSVITPITGSNSISTCLASLVLVGGDIQTGSYTPATTAGTNVSSCTFTRAWFTRTKYTVHVTVAGTLTSAATGLTKIEIDIPFNCRSDVDLMGSGVIDEDGQLSFVSGTVRYSTASTVTLTFLSQISGSKEFVINFDYIKS